MCSFDVYECVSLAEFLVVNVEYYLLDLDYVC